MRTITIGVDLAKQVFSACGLDATGRVQQRRELSRPAFERWLVQMPAGTIIAMEACSGAHHCARGDAYLRTLLIQIARSSVQRATAVCVERATPKQVWIRDLSRRMPFGKLLVAIANKHTRQLWAMLARDEDYDAHAWLRHPMVQRPRKTPVAANG